MPVKSVLEKLLTLKSEPTTYSPSSTHPTDFNHGTSTSSGYSSRYPAGNVSAPPVTTEKQNKSEPLEQNNVGIKHDSDKPRVSLLPGLALEQVVKVSEYGAKKYGSHNYRKGMAVTRYIDAAFRHIFIEWLFKGIDNDPESGLPHLAHGAWNVLAACQQMLEKPELDDRYKECK